MPEKDFFKISEIVERWKVIEPDCSMDQIIQLGASGSLALNLFINDKAIIEGMYKGHPPLRKNFGINLFNFLSFDQRYNNKLTSIHGSNIDGRYSYDFKIFYKDQLKVFKYNTLKDRDADPTLLILEKDYDVNVNDNYIDLLFLAHPFDMFMMLPDFSNYVGGLNVYIARGFERLRSEDIKILMSEERVQIEFLYANPEGNYFKCLVLGKEALPWVTKDDLYITRQERSRFEQDYSVFSIEERDIAHDKIDELSAEDKEILKEKVQWLLDRSARLRHLWWKDLAKRFRELNPTITQRDAASLIRNECKRALDAWPELANDEDPPTIETIRGIILVDWNISPATFSTKFPQTPTKS